MFESQIQRHGHTRPLAPFTIVCTPLATCHFCLIFPEGIFNPINVCLGFPYAVAGFRAFMLQ
jgi:hypothetical protein